MFLGCWRIVMDLQSQCAFILESQEWHMQKKLQGITVQEAKLFQAFILREIVPFKLEFFQKLQQMWRIKKMHASDDVSVLDKTKNFLSCGMAWGSYELQVAVFKSALSVLCMRQLKKVVAMVLILHMRRTCVNMVLCCKKKMQWALRSHVSKKIGLHVV